MVEDSAFLAELIEDMLTEAGAIVVGSASSVDAALNELRGRSVDLVCLDIMLGPELSFAVADALTAQRIPFVFVTACDRQNRARAAPPAAADRQDGPGGAARRDMLGGAGLSSIAGLILIAVRSGSLSYRTAGLQRSIDRRSIQLSTLMVIVLRTARWVASDATSLRAHDS